MIRYIEEIAPYALEIAHYPLGIAHYIAKPALHALQIRPNSLGNNRLHRKLQHPSQPTPRKP